MRSRAHSLECVDTPNRLSRQILPRLIFAGALVTMAIGETYVRIVIDTEAPSYVCPDKR
jgi:hypothetical protein